MEFKNIIGNMFVYGTESEHRELIIKTKDKVLYEGKISTVPSNVIFSGWIIISINPNYEKRKEEKYLNIPDYNLPYIIEVV